MGDQLTKDQLEIMWQGATRFAAQCGQDYKAACKEFGRFSSTATSAWKRYLRADKERREAQEKWEAA